MFSIADMAVAGAVALLLFGPDQLPKVARRAGQLVRDVQNTSQSFIREMERAADSQDHERRAADDDSLPPLGSSAVPTYHEMPVPAHAASLEAGSNVMPEADDFPAAGPASAPMAAAHDADTDLFRQGAAVVAARSGRDDAPAAANAGDAVSAEPPAAGDAGASSNSRQPTP